MQRLIEVSHIDLSIAADDLVALDERTIVDKWLSLALKMQGGRGMGGLELIRSDDLGGMLRDPAAHLGVLRVAGFLGHVLLLRLLLLAGCIEQKNVLHCSYLLDY